MPTWRCTPHQENKRPRARFAPTMRVRDAHFFRRVPADVSEATKSGGIISIVAILTICWLVLTQFSEYTTSKHTTRDARCSPIQRVP